MELVTGFGFQVASLNRAHSLMLIAHNSRRTVHLLLCHCEGRSDEAISV